MMVARLYDIYEGKIVDITIRDTVSIFSRDVVIIKNDSGQETMANVIRIFDTSDTFETSSAEFLRKATAHDLQKIEGLKEKSRNAFVIFTEKVKAYNCPMKPVSVQYSFNNKNIHLTFTAPERVDFRDLLKELVSTFKKKIFLEQIGPKDRAKVFGGFGKCGHQQCCSTFLQQLPSVTMEAVRQQHLLYKSSSKLLGACGKLLCCLTYEIDLYKELSRNFPSLGSIVEANKQRATVVGMDILNQTIRIQYEQTEKIETIAIRHIKILEEKKTEELLIEEDEKIEYEKETPISTNM